MEQYFSVGLQAPMSFSYPVYVLAGVCLAAALVFYILARREGADERPVRTPLAAEELLDLKSYYILQMGTLYKEAQAGARAPRDAYERLSFLFRSFAQDAHGLPLQSVTLREIRAAGDKNLYRLMSEYYEPEFAAMTSADVLSSIRKTMKVVDQWT